MMISTQNFCKELEKYKIGPYIYVPCSLLEPIISYVLENNRDIEVINPVNEAIAVGIATGSYMATGKIPVVMLQNSGFLNTLNALTSLNRLYKVPFLYIITWRGCQKDGKDAPEHQIIGGDLKTYLKDFRVPSEVISPLGYKREIANIITVIKRTKEPAALILRKGILQSYQVKKDIKVEADISCFSAIKIIKETMYKDAILFISTNGYISRNSFLAKDTKDFYMLGSMGHALTIGIGIALKTPKKKVIVLDGDGGALMHSGAMASVTHGYLQNLVHIILDNGVYASTGGQPTLSRNIDFCMIAKGYGYKNIFSVKTERELKEILKKVFKLNGPSFVHILINRNYIEAPRVSDEYSPEQIKQRFMKQVRRK
jgi:phosphonopyruvate decarboxylase